MLNFIKLKHSIKANNERSKYKRTNVKLHLHVSVLKVRQRK